MVTRSFHRFTSVLFILILVINTVVLAQNQLTVPRVSPHASITQTIGISTIKIDYHRPAVNGREVWGDVVPYGLTNLGFGNGNPAPWRAGANENTTISFSHDAMVNGNKVDAGTYGLHMIPSQGEWTIIFSNQTTAWGSYFYDEAEDYLRFNVSPQETDFTEWLTYTFDDITSNSVIASLRWENLMIPFKIEFDLHKIVIESFEDELIGSAGFFWNAYDQAATYCVNNNVYLDKAMVWADKAISLNRTLPTLITKSRILVASGKEEEADKLVDEALQIGSENEVNMYGYQLMTQGNIDKAIEIFEYNIDRNPESWNVYDSLGEALKNKGEIEKSRDAYKKARSLAPESQKARIDQILSTL
ncbi:MAG: DUF2911 domain-containing protein [Ignavibacteriales bacterium]|nr:MAG: DUF2911 domain-containing protein [Ignavibacteriales bacterium]